MRYAARIENIETQMRMVRTAKWRKMRSEICSEAEFMQKWVKASDILDNNFKRIIAKRLWEEDNWKIDANGVEMSIDWLAD